MDMNMFLICTTDRKYEPEHKCKLQEVAKFWLFY